MIYIAQIFGQHIASTVLKYLEFPDEVSFENYIKIIENFANTKRKEIILFIFLCYDIDQDGYVSHKDLFSYFTLSGHYAELQARDETGLSHEIKNLGNPFLDDITRII